MSSILPKLFQIRENIAGERYVITRVSKDFTFFLYNNGICSLCENNQVIEKLITDKYKDFESAIKSPEFRLNIG